MKALKIISLIFILTSHSLFSQTDSDWNKLKLGLKAGNELRNNAVVLGFSWNIYLNKHNIISPEITLLGIPWISGTYSHEVTLSDKFNIAPHFGLGISPMIVHYYTEFIAGVNISYKISKNNSIFIESRIYSMTRELHSAGKGIFEIENIHEQKPITITFGISF